MDIWVQRLNPKCKIVSKTSSSKIFPLPRKASLESTTVLPLSLAFVNKFPYPGDANGKESACNAGDPGSIPGWERYLGEGNGNPLQYSCLENFHEQRSLVGCSSWGHKESDTTEQLTLLLPYYPYPNPNCNGD